jgi:hypothetical protein
MQFLRRLIAMAAPEPAPIIGAVTVDVEELASVESAPDYGQQEKVRIRAILCGDEATGREALANHLALETGLSIADAKSALSASRRKTETQSTDATSTPDVRTARIRQAEAAFKLAFRCAEHSVPDAPDEPMSIISRMQANYAAAQGIPARKSNQSK